MIIRIFEDLRGRCCEGFVANDLQGGAPDRITDHILIETFHQHTQMVADGLFSTCSASRIASSSSTGPRFRRFPAKWPMTTASSNRQAARAVEFTIPHPAALPLHRDRRQCWLFGPRRPILGPQVAYSYCNLVFRQSISLNFTGYSPLIRLSSCCPIMINSEESGFCSVKIVPSIFHNNCIFFTVG